jgi:hypothetical protein
MDAIASPSRNADGSSKNPGAAILVDVEDFAEAAARQIQSVAHSVGDFISIEEARVRAAAEIVHRDGEAVAHVAEAVAPNEAPAVVAEVEKVVEAAAPVVAEVAPIVENVVADAAPVVEAVAANGI